MQNFLIGLSRKSTHMMITNYHQLGIRTNLLRELELKTGIRTNLLLELELKKVGKRPKMRNETQGEKGIVSKGIISNIKKT